MSTNLHYRLPKGYKSHCFAWQLKFYLAPIIWDQDGSLGSEETYIAYDDPIVKTIELLSKRKDNIGKEAKFLLKLLKKYQEVYLQLIS